MPTSREIKLSSDNTSLDQTETKKKSSGIKNGDFMRHLCERAADQTRQETDSAISSSQSDKGKGQLSAEQVALEDRPRESMPVGENGERAERIVNLINDKLRGGMRRGDGASSSGAVTSERLYPKLIDIDNQLKLFKLENSNRNGDLAKKIVEVEEKLKSPCNDDEYDSLIVQRDRLPAKMRENDREYSDKVEGFIK